MAAPGTADKALAGAVGPAPLGDPHPVHRWPARSCIYHPDQEIALCPPGTPVPQQLPSQMNLPRGTRSSHRAFPGGKAAAFLGKSPQDAGEMHRAAWKRPRFHHASLEHAFLKSWSWEQGWAARLEHTHTWDFERVLVNSVLLSVQVLQAHGFHLHRGVLRGRQGGVRADNQDSQANPQDDLHNAPELRLARQSKQHSKHGLQTVQSSAQLHKSNKEERNSRSEKEKPVAFG